LKGKIIFTTRNSYNYTKIKANNINIDYKLVSTNIVVPALKCYWAIRMSCL